MKALKIFEIIFASKKIYRFDNILKGEVTL